MLRCTKLLSTPYCGKLHFADSHEIISTEEEIIDIHRWLSLCSIVILRLNM
jgi:hypothetical protein